MNSQERNAEEDVFAAQFASDERTEKHSNKAVPCSQKLKPALCFGSATRRAMRGISGGRFKIRSIGSREQIGAAMEANLQKGR